MTPWLSYYSDRDDAKASGPATARAFLKLLDYTLEDVAGKHHSMLVSATYRASAEYQDLWAKLGRGEYQAGEYLCISKSGKEVWLQGYYAPTLDAKGKLVPGYLRELAPALELEHEAMAEELCALGKNVDHGYKVAATGELSLDGRVGEIGGIKQKTIGAREAGVDVFLVPTANAADARKYAHGLRIIPVKNFQQALRALATLPAKRSAS